VMYSQRPNSNSKLLKAGPTPLSPTTIGSPKLLRQILRLGLTLAVLLQTFGFLIGTGSVALAQDTVTKTGQDNSTKSTTETRAGRVDNWVVNYDNTGNQQAFITPQILLNDVLDSKTQQFVVGSMQTPPNWQTGYSNAPNGASPYTYQPVAGAGGVDATVTGIQWAGSNVTVPPKSVTTQLQPNLQGFNTVGNSGDGYMPIIYNNRLYDMNHHADSNSSPFRCLDVTTGLACNGWVNGSKTILPAIYNPQDQFWSTASPMPVIVAGKLYYPVDRVRGARGQGGWQGPNDPDTGAGTICYDLVADDWCANSYTQLWIADNYVGGGATLATLPRYNATAMVASGNEIYVISHFGIAGCLNTVTNAPCAGQPYNLYNFTLAGLPPAGDFTLGRSYPEIDASVDPATGYILISRGGISANGQTQPANAELGCFNPATKNACPNWGTAINIGANFANDAAAIGDTQLDVHPLLISTGGVFTEYAIQNPHTNVQVCYLIATATPCAAFPNFPVATSTTAAPGQALGKATYFPGAWSVWNNRVYIAHNNTTIFGSNPGAQAGSFITCYDMTTQAMCANFGLAAGSPNGTAYPGFEWWSGDAASGGDGWGRGKDLNPSEPNRNLKSQDYNYVFDANGCGYGWGNAGILWSFDAATGVTPCPQIKTASLAALTPAAYYCDGSQARNHTYGYLKLEQALPVNASVTVTARNAATGTQVFGPATIGAGQQTVDFSSINYAANPSIIVDISYTGLTQATNVAAFFTTVDPVQFCFQTKVPDTYLPGSTGYNSKVTNTANGPNGSTGTATLNIPKAALSIVKTVQEAQVSPGDTIHYQVVVSNAGPLDANNTIFSDALPAELGAPVTATTSQGTLTVTGTNITGDLGTVLVGGSVTINITAKVVATTAGNIVNTAHTSSPADPTGDKTSTVTTPIKAAANLSITKVSNPQTNVGRGDPLSYLITVSNAGPSDATNVMLSDPLPAELTGPYGATSSQGTVTVTGSTVAGNLGTIAVGGTVTVNITGTVASSAPAPGTITNKATVTTVDDPGTPKTGTTTTQVLPPGISINKTVDKAQAQAGDTLTYSVVVSNTGQTPLNGIAVTDPNPVQGATLVANSITLTPASAGTAGTSLPALATLNLPVGQQATIGFKLQLPTSGFTPGQTITNTATATPPQSSGLPPVKASATTTILIPAIAIAKTVDKAQAIPGDTLTYNVTVSNTGQTTLTGIAVTDPNPVQGATLVAGSISLSPAAAGTAGSSLPALATLNLNAGQAANISFKLQLPTSGFTPGQVVTNTATATPPQSSGLPPVQASAPTSILIPGIAIAKSVDKATAQGGDVLTYAVVVSNTGQTNLSNIMVTDPTPVSGATLITNSITLSPAAAGTAGSSLPALATLNLNAGQSATISFKLQLPPQSQLTGVQTITNTATATPPQGSGLNPVQGSASTNLLQPGLGISKQVDKAQVIPGDIVTYSIVVSNTGQTNLSNIALADPVPVQGATLVANSITLTPASAGTAGTSLPALATLNLTPGQQALVSFKLQLPTSGLNAGQTITNTATATPPASSGLPPVQGSAISTVQQPGIAIAKSVDKATPVPGDILTYTITVNDTGQTTLTGINVTDPNPVQGATLVANSITLTPASAGTAGNSLPNLATLNLTAGQSATIKFQLQLPTTGLTNGQTITNTATATPPQSSGLPPVQGSAISTIQQPGIAIAKTADRISAMPGDTITYTVTVSNTGQTTLSGIAVTDPGPPQGGTLVANSITLSPAGAGTAGSSLPALATLNLAAGQSATIKYQLQLPTSGLSAGQTVTNTATATPPQSSGLPPVKSSAGVLIQVPGIAISKLVDKAQAQAGDVLTYSVVVSNTGQTPLNGIAVTDPNLVQGATLVANSITLSPAGAGTAGTALPNLASLNLAAGQSATISFKLQLPTSGLVAGQQILNEVTATSPAGSGLPPVKATVTTVVAPPGLSVTKQVDKATAKPGEVVTYNITVSNTGQTTLTGITVNDPAPVAGATLVAGSVALSPAGAGTVGSSLPSLATLNLNAGQQAIVTFKLQLPTSGLTDGQVVTNQVTITPPQGSGLSQMQASATTSISNPPTPTPTATPTPAPAASPTPVPGVANLSSSSKQAAVLVTGPDGTIVTTADSTNPNQQGPLTARPGDTVRYTINVYNTGSVDATGVNVLDSLDPLLENAPFEISNGGSFDAGTRALKWTNLTIPAAKDVKTPGQLVLTFKVKVRGDAGAGSVINNKAVITPPTGGGPGSGGEPAAPPITVIRPSVQLKKTVRDITSSNGSSSSSSTSTTAGGTPNPARPGDTVEFTVRLTNSGNSPLTNLEFTDGYDYLTGGNPNMKGSTYVGNSAVAYLENPSDSGAANAQVAEQPADGTAKGRLLVKVPGLALNQVLVVKFRAKLSTNLADLPGGKLTNQASATSQEIKQLLTSTNQNSDGILPSDDPNTPEPADPTIIPIVPQPQGQPTIPTPGATPTPGPVPAQTGGGFFDMLLAPAFGSESAAAIGSGNDNGSVSTSTSSGGAANSSTPGSKPNPSFWGSRLMVLLLAGLGLLGGLGGGIGWFWWNKNVKAAGKGNNIMRRKR